MTLDKLDEIVARDLRTNINNTNASAGMQDLFANYHTILSRNGLKWIISDNQKVSMQQLLSEIKPTSLRERLDSDVAFSYHPLPKTFTWFLTHAVKLVEAFQLVDSEPPSKHNQSKNKSSRS